MISSLECMLCALITIGIASILGIQSFFPLVLLVAVAQGLVTSMLKIKGVWK